MISKFHAAAAALLLVFAASPLAARAWKPDAQARALEYSQILDNKGKGELVMVWWVTPETLPPSTANQNLRGLLARYTVVGVAHGKSAGGKLAFEPIPALTIADAGGKRFTPLNPDAVPAALGSALTTLQTMVRQSLGSTGEGVRWFVFDAPGIKSCEPGRVSIPYGGETYTYDTPIPGCGG